MGHVVYDDYAGVLFDANGFSGPSLTQFVWLPIQIEFSDSAYGAEIPGIKTDKHPLPERYLHPPRQAEPRPIGRMPPNVPAWFAIQDNLAPQPAMDSSSLRLVARRMQLLSPYPTNHG